MKLRSATRRPLPLIALVLSAGIAGPLAAATLSNSATTAGGRQSSASYTVDSSLGGIGGLGTAGSTTARHGFAGQLFEVKTVTVAASPATLNESSTRQLTASATLDDASFLTLAGTDVTWSVVTGPVASVSSAALATASAVYQDTAATVRGGHQGVFGSLALTVLNVTTDDFGAYAGDGIDDAWQVQFFGVGSGSAAPSADPDADGQNNLFEYLAGTTPTNNASLFALSLGVAGAGQRAVVFNPVVAGRTYSVEFRTNIATGSFAGVTGATTSDNGATRTVTDVNATNATRFYRVRISLP